MPGTLQISSNSSRAGEGIWLRLRTARSQTVLTNLDHDEISASAGIAALTIVYFMSRVVSFWGAEKAAFRVLIAFGSFWLVFALLSHPGLVGLAEGAVALPFFLPAFSGRRWPRASGALLLLAAALAFWFFGLAKAFRGNQGSLTVILLFVVPLAAMGIALLAERREEAGAAR